MVRLPRLFKQATLTAKFGLIVICIWIVCALFANKIAPYDPSRSSIKNRLIPPTWCKGGVPEHVLGTDELGRDVLSRLLCGSTISLIVALMSVLVSLLIGTSLGMLAGFYGGLTDTIIMRAVDVMLALPFMFLALCMMAVLGPSLRNVILVIGVTGWVPYARTIRANVLALRKREFVLSAEALGASPRRIMFKHIMPNVIDAAIVLGTLEMAGSIISEAALTFLGMGVPPTIATWGQMLSTGRDYIFTSWWLTTFPGLAIFIVCLSVNFVGDWMRDLRDPRLKGAQ